MKKKLDYLLILFVLVLILIDVLGKEKIYTAYKRWQNGTEVYKKNYSLNLPQNWSIYETSKQSNSTLLIGYKTDTLENNLFMINLYALDFKPKELLTKWSQCDARTFYPFTTSQGKHLALLLCSFDFNATTQQKPSLTLNDANGNIIAAAYDWKPYYNNEYLKVFKSIKFDKNSSIKEISLKKFNDE